MKLTHIRIKDFRSFSGEHMFDVSSGINYFVGPNNSGKSNLIRALELALDPSAEYIGERDRPANGGSSGGGQPRVTRITLTFQAGTSQPETTLLLRAKQYEQAVRKGRPGRTYAEDRELRMVTSFAGGLRQTTFGARGTGANALSAESAEHRKLEEQFRKVLRFAVIHSGEDLASLLNGKFREILQLVIADHLGDEVTTARAARNQYLQSLQQELLEPLRQRVLERVAGIFPEITVAELVPAVPTVEATLSSVDVRLGDAITTQLTEKGTGVRGAVLVSMLRYLAEQSRRSLVLAVEEPEAFLHPAAQEMIRAELEDLATRSDVTLLVTTHAPYVISRRPDARVTELRKSADGNTRKASTAAGHERRAEMLGSLYRDAGMASILERALTIPSDCRGVLITEGYTDGAFLRAAAAVAARPDLMEGIHVIEANGAKRIIFQAVLAQSATQLPVVALLDFDDNGRSAQHQLEDFGWSKSREILSLSNWPNRCRHGHHVEIEDLVPASVCERIIQDLGEAVAVIAKRQCGGTWHYEFSDLWKQRAIAELPRLLKHADTAGLVWAAEQINDRLDRVGKAKASAAAHAAVVPQG